ncbi:MAG: glycosyltransferase family 2 protein [Candidatus Marinimicrobia bacterium]|nr:glycosyltransferase family 2 protein [Candidatus Neomarinimicrobiota bacterium]MCF7840262.1 glycosyltransferase family 2 protein [Candidatus Neomarinimicrobiota bacterium]
MNKPLISVITLSWDNQPFTEAFVASIRKNTTLPYELIIVDNGSAAETQHWVQQVADRALIFAENQGFPGGFNQGAALADGQYLMMANNDTEFPPHWDERLVETMEKNLNAGIVSPAYTSGRKSAVRFEPGTGVKTIGRFRKYPSGVAFFVRKDQFLYEFGGWSTAYSVASGEDADLCFTVWKKGYDILVDERVLVIHEGKVTSGSKLADWQTHFRTNSRQFKQKWFYHFYFPYLARMTEWLRKKVDPRV